jgi:hypothetical protein
MSSRRKSIRKVIGKLRVSSVALNGKYERSIAEVARAEEELIGWRRFADVQRSTSGPPKHLIPNPRIFVTPPSPRCGEEEDTCAAPKPRIPISKIKVTPSSSFGEEEKGGMTTPQVAHELGMHLYLQDTQLKDKLATHLGLQDTRHAGQLGMLILFQVWCNKVNHEKEGIELAGVQVVKNSEAVSVVATRPVHSMSNHIAIEYQ